MTKSRNSKILYAAFAVLMAVLGASDALRGVLAPVFKAHFALSMSQVSMVVTASYAGNFVFLFFGGKVLDRAPRKPAVLLCGLVWAAAVCLFALTDSYPCLLAGMFFALGASTLLGTAVTLTTPLLFASSPATLVNVLFFVQGIGTVSSQGIAGSRVTGFGAWRAVNVLLLCLGVAAMGVILFCRFPQKSAAVKRVPPVKVRVNRTFLAMLLIFGFYFIAEHGVMNWLVSYAMSEFSLPQGTAAGYTAAFFACVMGGRFLFSPLTDRLGVFRCMKLFSAAAAVLYAAGVLLGAGGLWLLAASGVFFSILYPTLVFSVSLLWPAEVSSGVCGTLLSVASLADIGFNAGFGRLVDLAGFRTSFWIMPLSMAACAVLLFLLCKRKSGARA